MAKRHTPGRIIGTLCEAERRAGEDSSTAEAAKQIEVSEQILHRWRHQCGGNR